MPFGSSEGGEVYFKVNALFTCYAKNRGMPLHAPAILKYPIGICYMITAWIAATRIVGAGDDES
jgi:hypothetical protein